MRRDDHRIYPPALSDAFAAGIRMGDFKPPIEAESDGVLRGMVFPFTLGLTQALTLPVIGYVTLLELVFMVCAPFLFLYFRKSEALARLLRVLTWLIAYGAVGACVSIFAKADAGDIARHIVSLYLLIACLFCLTLILQAGSTFYRCFLVGYGLWPLLRLALGPFTADQIWFVDPWSYGLGTCLPIFVLAAVPAARGRSWRAAAGALLLPFVVLSFVFDARSTGLLTLTCAVALITLRPASQHGKRLTSLRGVIAATFLVIAAGAGFAVYAYLAKSGELGSGVRALYEEQFTNPYGPLAAIRPDFLVGLEAVARRPLLGYGATQWDHAAEFHARRAQLWLQAGTAKNFVAGFERGQIPSHSILLQAWINAGLLGGLLWLWLLAMTAGTIPLSATSNAPLAPLCLCLSLINAWVIPFSAGPPRVDVALGLAVMFLFRNESRLHANDSA